MNVLHEHHDAPLAGHCGVARTLELLTRNYWFPGVNAFVKEYINSCYSCQYAKAPRHLRHGELAPLPVPSSPWKGLSCDFITDLPVSNGKDSILVFVDRMSRMNHFIPCSKANDAPDFRVELGPPARPHTIVLDSDRNPAGNRVRLFGNGLLSGSFCFSEL